MITAGSRNAIVLLKPHCQNDKYYVRIFDMKDNNHENCHTRTKASEHHGQHDLQHIKNGEFEIIGQRHTCNNITYMRANKIVQNE